MQVFQKRQGELKPVDLAEAIADSVGNDVSREGELETIRAKLDAQAEAFGKLFAYVVNGDHSDEAKRNLVNEVISYRYEVRD
jgi:hypothetical protein